MREQPIKNETNKQICSLIKFSMAIRYFNDPTFNFGIVLHQQPDKSEEVRSALPCLANWPNPLSKSISYY